MDFYITDRTFALQTVISTDGNTPFKVISTEDVSNLETSSRRMSLEISFTPETTSKAKDIFKVGNYVLYVDLVGKYEWMTILKSSHNPLTQVRSLECEDAGLDLLNETVSTYKADKAYNVAHYINKFTTDSGFKIGVNEISNLTRKLEWEGEATALERVQSVATQFDNAEIEFRFDFVGNQLAQRYIDIKKKRGTTDFHRMYVNRDIHSIVVEEDIYELVNAIYATGGTEEGKDQPINLKGYTWKDPNGRFMLEKSTGLIKDTQNIKQWSRENNNAHYFVQHKSWETTNKNTLINNVVSHLKKYSVPVVNYVVDIANIPDMLQVGDNVELVDENEQLYLSSRVQQLTFKYEEGSCEAVLSDFVRLKSGIADQLREMQINIKNETEAKFNSVPQVFVQQTEPTSPKENDIWWVQGATREFRSLDLPSLLADPPMIEAYKVYRNGAWEEQTIDQSVLNIEVLNAVTINGSTINGSEFINTWNKTEAITGGQARRRGTTTITEGAISQNNDTLITVTGGAEKLRTQESTLIQYGQILNTISTYDVATGTTLQTKSNGLISADRVYLNELDYTVANTETNQQATLEPDRIQFNTVRTVGSNPAQVINNTKIEAAGITVNDKKQFGSFYSAGPDMANITTGTLLRVGDYMGTDFNTSTAEHNKLIVFNAPNRDVFMVTEKCTIKIDVNFRIQGNGSTSQSRYVYTHLVKGTNTSQLTLDNSVGVIHAIGSYTGNLSPNFRFINTGSIVLDVNANDMLAFVVDLEGSKYSFRTSLISTQITKVFKV